MCNLLKPTVDQMVFRQYYMPEHGHFHRDQPVRAEDTRRDAAPSRRPAPLTLVVPALTMMAAALAFGYMALTLIELAGLELQHAFKPLTGMNEFLNADALGRTLKAQTMSFARAGMRLPV